MKTIESLYNDVLNIVDKENIQNIDMREYSKKVFEIAKNEDNLSNIINLIFNDEYFLQNFGNNYDNVIEIDSKVVNPARIIDLTTTIFRLSRYYYQNAQKIEVDKHIEPKMPVAYCSFPIENLNEKEIGMKIFDIFNTSQNEKDARDTSLARSKQLFDYLQDNATNKEVKDYLQTVSKDLNKMISFENVSYTNSMYNLYFDQEKLKQVVTNEVKNEIESFKRNPLNYSKFFEDINALLILYCDENIKTDIKKTISPYIQNVDILLNYIYVHNYPYWNTTSNDLNEIFALARKTHIPFELVAGKLPNFDKNDLVKRFSNFFEGTAESKKTTTFSNEKNETDYYI